MQASPAAFVAAIVLLSLALAGCERETEKKPLPPPPVKVSLPIEREVVDYVDFTGRTEARETVEVRARVTGYLEAIPFKEGTEVKAKDILFKIDPRPYNAALARDEGQLKLAEAELKLAIANYERGKEVAKTKGAISEQELDQLRAKQEVAAASVAAAKASVESSSLNVDFCTVRSPIDGRIGRYYKSIGNLVNQDVTTLTTIVSQDPMYAYFAVDERTMLDVQTRIRQGKLKGVREGQIMPVLMGLANEDGFPHQGTLNFVDNRVDKSTGTLQVRGSFDNPKPKFGESRLLAPGMFLRIRVPLGDPYQAVLVNERAIGTDQDKKFVYIVNEKDEVEVRVVTLGKLYDSLRVIAKGVDAGERVIVSGLQRVRPKMTVAPAPVPMP